MRIAIDARLILPEMTGVGRYLVGLAMGLCALPGDDHFEIWLQAGLPSSHPIWQLHSERLTLRPVPFRHMDLRQQWLVPAELRRHSPDLFHYPHFDLPWAVTGRVVATIHDLKYLARPDFFPRIARAKRLVMHAMMAYTVWRANRVIVDSESTRHDLVQRLNAFPEKIRVVPLGVGSHYYQSPSQESLEIARKRYGLDTPFLLFVGERRPHKNIAGTLQAFQLFRQMVSVPYRLVIAGKPYADYQEPEQMVEKLGLGDSVQFLDYVPDADLPCLYRAADALLLLSFYEGFGLPVLEAMASGTPVVTSDATSLPEVAGDAGLLVPADDPEAAAHALQRVIRGGDLRGETIARGLERARQFTWERCAAQTISVYREAMEG